MANIYEVNLPNGKTVRIESDVPPSKEKIASLSAQLAAAPEENPAGSAITAPIKSLAAGAAGSVADISKGLQVAAQYAPGYFGDAMIMPGPATEAMTQDARRRMNQSPSEKMAEITSGPLFEAGKQIHKDIQDRIPLTKDEQGRTSVKLAGMIGGLAPYVAAAPAAPLTIGLQTIGANVDAIYDKELSDGKNPDEAANSALNKSLADGAIQSAIFGLAPAPLRKMGDAAVQKFGGTVIRNMVAKRAADVAEGATLGTLSQVGGNAVKGEDITSGIGGSAMAMGGLQGLMGAVHGRATPAPAKQRVSIMDELGNVKAGMPLPELTAKVQETSLAPVEPVAPAPLIPWAENPGQVTQPADRTLLADLMQDKAPPEATHQARGTLLSELAQSGDVAPVIGGPLAQPNLRSSGVGDGFQLPEPKATMDFGQDKTPAQQVAEHKAFSDSVANITKELTDNGVDVPRQTAVKLAVIRDPVERATEIAKLIDSINPALKRSRLETELPESNPAGPAKKKSTIGELPVISGPDAGIGALGEAPLPSNPRAIELERPLYDSGIKDERGRPIMVDENGRIPGVPVGKGRAREKGAIINPLHDGPDYAGFQEDGNGGGFELWNLNKPILGKDGEVLHPDGSTVSTQTLEKYGIPVPEKPAKGPMSSERGSVINPITPALDYAYKGIKNGYNKINDAMLEAMAKTDVKNSQDARAAKEATVKALQPWSKKDEVPASEMPVNNEPAATHQGPVDNAIDFAKPWTPILGAADQVVGKIGIITDNIRSVAPEVAGHVREMARDEITRTAKLYDEAMPGLEKLRKYFGKKEFEKIGIALQNGKEAEVIRALKGIEGEPELATALDGWIKVRDPLHEALKESRPGEEIGYQENYWPRKVSDLKGLRKFLDKNDPDPMKHALESAVRLKRAATGNEFATLTADEEASALANLLEGSRRFPSKEGHLKARTIKEIDQNAGKFYEPLDVALDHYIGKISRDISLRKFLGKTDQAASSPWVGGQDSGPVGATIARLIREGEINDEGARVLLENINAYVGRAAAPGWGFSIARNIGVIQTLGNLGQITNTIAQLGDVFQTAANRDVPTALKGFSEAIRNKGAKLEDISLHEGGQEVNEYSRHSGKVNKTVNFVLDPYLQLTKDIKLKTPSFKWSDRVGKETFMNATRIWATKNANSANPSHRFETTMRKYGEMFGPEELAATMEAMKKADWLQPELKKFMFNELADIQPTSRADMPLGMMQASPLMRIPWRLTSFSLRQIGRAKTQIVDEWRAGHREKAALWAASYMFWAMVGNSAIQYARDLASGKETASPGDYAFGSVAQMAGSNKVQLLQGTKTGGLAGVVGERMIPGAFGVANDFFKDVGTIRDLATGQTDLQNAHSELVKRLPWGGSTYYNWFGGGHEKEMQRMRQRNQPTDLETISHAILGSNTRPKR